MYSVMIGSSTNFAWRSTSAAASRPMRTSFSVEPLILAMMPELIFRLPIIAGSSLADKGFFPGVVEAVVFFLSEVLASWATSGFGAVLAAGSAGFGVVVWPTAAIELANSDTINTKALVAREKLFIAETSKINRYEPEGRGGVVFANSGAQSMMLGFGS